MNLTDPDIRQCDGVRVHLRPVHADDRERFREGFQNLSDEARYSRCFNHRISLTAAELDMLCDVNGAGGPQEALVALSLDDDGHECDSIGGARFFMSPGNIETAEMAFLVTDEWQGKQVGQWLLSNLVNRARARGVCYLRCHLLPGNNKARGLLSKVSSLTDSKMIVDEDGVLLELGSLQERESCCL